MERDRRTQPQGFPALESRARVHSLIQVGGEGLPFRGGDVGLRRSKGSGPTARLWMALDVQAAGTSPSWATSSTCRRGEWGGRQVRGGSQVRWLRLPAAVSAAHPTEPRCGLLPRNQQPDTLAW